MTHFDNSKARPVPEKWEHDFLKFIKRIGLDEYGNNNRRFNRFETEYNGFDNGVFYIRPHNNEDESVNKLPNFHHYETGFEILWEGRPLNNAVMNKRASGRDFTQIMLDCERSILGKKR